LNTMRVREKWKRLSEQELYALLWAVQGAFDVLVAVILIAYVR